VVLLGDDDHEDRDRLVLRWRRGPEASQASVRISDRQPANGVTPILDAIETDEKNLDLTDSGGVRIAKVRRHLGYKRLWWNIRRIAPGGRTTYSAAQSVRVVPRPVTKASAKARVARKLGSSSRKPCSVRLAVTSSPLAKVTVRVTRGGRTVEVDVLGLAAARASCFGHPAGEAVAGAAKREFAEVAAAVDGGQDAQHAVIDPHLVIPNFSAIEQIAAHCDGYSARCSKTILTADRGRHADTATSYPRS
jgi:hypothetical protein